ncbi:TonB-dependent receptor [Roseateles sp. DAIF2]|uniref:TonB-dependent receptor plug domain-containing protein n=1 Tax=Roseateles sp. DAIF2 TaxID=2714952 RepID=UPI0018A2FEBF|nr:TonB-dependent receptor [Roseateles sp. DAIF2]QPF75672.1 TonB-dependent receptor [Roseateles sp. DAIF2]
MAALICCAQVQAQAQDPQKLDKVVVVGSNIKRVSAEGPLAVEVIKREQIQASGASTAIEVLSQLTATDSYETGTTSNSFAQGAATVSLRGMGAKNVLILLNGRRLANYGYSENLSQSSVDINSLPLNAIDQIEILRDGASAIYGSDAVAGVINFKTRQNFQGLESMTSVSRNQAGDESTISVGITGGIGDQAKDRYNLLFNIDLLQRDPRRPTEHKYTASLDQRPYGGLDNRAFNRGPGSYNVVNGFNANNRYAMPGCPTAQIEVDDRGDQYCRTDRAASDSTTPDITRAGFGLIGNLLLSDSTTLFSELTLNRTTAEWAEGYSYIANSTARYIQPTWATWRADLGTVTNPSTGVVSRSPLQIYRAISEAGQVQSKVESTSTRALLGVRGVYGAWDWETAAMLARNEVSTDDSNRLKSAEVLKALQTGSYNPWIQANPMASVLPMLASTHREATTQLSVVDLKVSNAEWFTLGGPVGFAGGLQAMHDKMEDTPDAAVARGEIENLGGTGAKGSRRVVSIYGELNLQPFKQLEIQAALRHDRYNDFGGTTNPKLAFAFRPMKEVLLRGNANTAFKAPSLPELYMGPSRAYTTVADWVRCKPLGYGSAQCKYSPELDIRANPELKPERTKVFSLGMVVEPVRDVFVSADAYQLRQRDTIQTLDAQYLLDHELTTPGFDKMVLRDPRNPNLEAQFPGLKHGRLKGLILPYMNVGRIETSGVDLSLKAGLTTDLGRFTLEHEFNKVFSYKQSDIEGQPLTSRLDGYLLPKWRNKVVLGFSRGPVKLRLTALTKADTLDYDSPANIHEGEEVKRLGSYTAWNAHASFQVLPNAKLSVGINNLFDKTPRFSQHYSNFRDSTTGRGFLATLEIKHF